MDGVIQVDSNAEVGKSVQITASRGGKETEKCVVIVVNPLSDVTIENMTVIAGRNSRMALMGTYIENLSYTSLNEEIFSVSANGTIQGKKGGEAKLRIERRAQ